MDTQEQDQYPPKGIDLERPNVARVYDWYLGGTANWAIDREFGEKIAELIPQVRTMAMSNRLYLNRAVRYLVKQGIRQFIDIGSGVPTMGNTHQVADEVAPDSKVVYIDNEPVAVAHSQVLLNEYGDPRRHAVINGDLRDPDRLWELIAETGVIDLNQPVAVLIVAVLHIEQPDPNGVDIGPRAVARVRELLPPNSYLALSAATNDGVPPDLYDAMEHMRRMYEASSSRVVWRTRDEVRDMLGDLELVPPGISWSATWHPEESSPTAPQIEFEMPNQSICFAGVGHKR